MAHFSRTFMAPALAALTLLSVSPAAAGPADKDKDVNVVNTPNVSVVNTPNVSVANTPSVSVVNTPTVLVGNTPDSPVNVVLPPRPAFQPFQKTLAISFDPPSNSDSEWFTVPEGKRLVIELVTFQGIIYPPGDEEHFVTITTVAAGMVAAHYLTPTHYGPFTGAHAAGLIRLHATHPVRLYADGGTNVGVLITREFPEGANGGSPEDKVSFSGYLEDVP
jgi:hypothetical protein